MNNYKPLPEYSVMENSNGDKTFFHVEDAKMTTVKGSFIFISADHTKADTGKRTYYVVDVKTYFKEIHSDDYEQAEALYNEIIGKTNQ